MARALDVDPVAYDELVNRLMHRGVPEDLARHAAKRTLRGASPNPPQRTRGPDYYETGIQWDNVPADKKDSVKTMFADAHKLWNSGDRVGGQNLAFAARLADSEFLKAMLYKRVFWSNELGRAKAADDASKTKEMENKLADLATRITLAEERGVISIPSTIVEKVVEKPTPAAAAAAEDLEALTSEFLSEGTPAAPPAPEEPVKPPAAPPPAPAPPPPPVEAPLPPPAPAPSMPHTTFGPRGSLDEARGRILARMEKAGLFSELPRTPLLPVRPLDDILTAFHQGSEGILGQDAAIRFSINALRNKDLFLAGPAGSGKSTIAKRVGPLAFDRDSLFASVDPGWVPGDITASLRADAFVDPSNGIELGYLFNALLADQWLILDEATRADMGIYYSPMMLARSLGFVTVPLLTPRKLFVPPWFRLIATANLGDEGTFRRPDAIKDRFGAGNVSYPSPEVEAGLLLAPEKGGLSTLGDVDGESSSEFARALVELAASTRLPESGFAKGITTRGLIDIARFITTGSKEPAGGGKTLYGTDDVGGAFVLADAAYVFITDSISSEGRKDDISRFKDMWRASVLATKHRLATRILETYLDVQLGRSKPVGMDIGAKTEAKVFKEARGRE